MRERCPECGFIYDENEVEYDKCDVDMGLWQVYHWCPCCGSPIDDYIVDSKGNIIGVTIPQDYEPMEEEEDFDPDDPTDAECYAEWERDYRRAV